jgi:hypothetical protein
MLVRLKQSGLLIHHDFQDGLVKKLGLADDDGRRLRIATPGSFGLPVNYRRLLEAVAAGMRPKLDGAGRAHLDEALARVGMELDALDSELDRAAAEWRGRPVVASVMQRELVERLGMRVVGELQRPEQMSPRDWQRLRAAEPGIIVGNLQSDATAAGQLGRQGGRPVAVLSNFPGAEGYGRDYPGLLRANVARIAAAWKPQ